MPLAVIGAGLSRTGTFSLKLALEALGIGRCYHMSEVGNNPSYATLWERVAEGGTPDWEEIFRGYGATMDYPGCFYYRALADRYPSAKIILSIRDPDAWFKSMRATVFSEERQTILGATPQARLANPIARMRDKTFPFDRHRSDDRDYMISIYHRHNEEVRRTIPPDRLLVYEVGDGWQPLCRFLGLSVPAEPFPQTNSAEEFRARDRRPD